MTQSFNWLDDVYVDDKGTPINEDGTGTLDNVVTTTTTGAPRSVRFVGATPTVTGFATGKAGRRLSVLAVGGDLVLANENAGSMAANRIVTGSGANVTIAQGGGAELRYDATSERWRLTSGGGSPGGGDAAEFRGRPVSTTAPEGGAAYVWDDVAEEWVPKKGLAVIHVDDFGAVADANVGGTGTDNADAIEDAIAAVGAFETAGEVIFSATPGKQYYCSRTIHVERTVKLRGQGGGLFYNGTAIGFPAGVTGFRVPSSASAPGGGGGRETVFEDLGILANGKNTNSGTATVAIGDYDVSLAAAGDFANGQLVALLGCGEQSYAAWIEGTVTSGSSDVTIAQTADGADPVLKADMYIKLGTAYPNPTRIASVAGQVLTMASAAAASVTDGRLVFCHDLITRIVSGGGTTTLTVSDGSLIRTSMTSKIIHADAAIDLESTAYVYRCSAGNTFGQGWQGPGFAIRGERTAVPETNANCSEISSCSAATCRHAVYTVGGDSNACRINVRATACTHWSFYDLSGLGNKYSTCHADGGLGYCTSDGNNRSGFDNCYAEVGTLVSLGNRALAVGGSMPMEPGGVSLTQMDQHYSPHYTSAITGDATFANYSAEFYAQAIEFTGALSANATLTFANYRSFPPKWIYNHTTGGYSITIKFATGNTETIPNGFAAMIVANTVEVYRVTPNIKPTVANSADPSVAMSALDVDWSLGGTFTKTLANGGNTITFSNATDGQTIIVALTGGGSSAVTWPTVKWAGGVAPTQTVGGTDIYTFVKLGATIYGSAVQALA